MIEYSDKVYKRISNAGAAGIVLGILVIISGITLGTMSIIFGGNLLSVRKHVVD